MVYYNFCLNQVVLASEYQPIEVETLVTMNASPLMLCAVLAISTLVSALPPQQPLGQHSEEPTHAKSRNLPLVVWHGLGDEYVLQFLHFTDRH